MSRYHPDALDRRDPRLIAETLPYLEWFNAKYFRLTIEGGADIPAGAVMFIGNHNGGILGPDVLCTLATLWRRLTPRSRLYALAHDFAMRHVKPVGLVVQRFGAVSASRANARRVLEDGGQILVYPGGDREAYRRFDRRNEVVLLPRTGFIHVAQALGVPIVPVVAHGAHRSAYIFAEGASLARWLRMPRWARLERFPLALALPWIFAPGPWLPYLPLPFRVRLRFLPAVRVSAHEEARRAACRIESDMQRALDTMTA